MSFPSFVVKNMSYRFVEPENNVPPEIVVADKLGATIAPVNVAPERFAFVASCELTVLNTLCKFVPPENKVPPEIVPPLIDVAVIVFN